MESKRVIIPGLLFALFSLLNQVLADCKVKGVMHASGETFNLSCRERCQCQGTAYGCISLCPGEDRMPMEDCRSPRLITIPGECCRQWMCNGDDIENTGDEIDDRDKNWDDKGKKPGGGVESKNPCLLYTSPWSTCSKTCGIGLSTRLSGDHKCRIRTESRLCFLKSCADDNDDKTKKATR